MSEPPVSQAPLPPAPLTIEGSSVLHQMFRFDWSAWRKLAEGDRSRIANEAMKLLQHMEQGAGEGHPNQSAMYSLLGHKGDLMLIHFRDSFADLNRVELALLQAEFSSYLQPTHSYLSVVELGLYESTAKTYAAAAQRGLEPFTPEWRASVDEVIARQANAMAARIFPAIPEAKYACFYPMDRRRGEQENWYMVPMAERQRMMHEHGMIGRRYADQVRQIITASIGFDDWEWGVDLFADEPLVFKKLIYEMRFDQVSAVYALFGSFYVGVRLPAEQLGPWLAGTLPS
ncbi:MAG TPA: hydrogen peroxide-dependent heme synthase [Acidisarcina sp.]